MVVVRWMTMFCIFGANIFRTKSGRKVRAVGLLPGHVHAIVVFLCIGWDRFLNKH